MSSLPGKTLNAVLFERISEGWGELGHSLCLVALISEAALLFVAAQTGFFGGPRVLGQYGARPLVPHAVHHAVATVW